jgi:hypothetical protein
MEKIKRKMMNQVTVKMKKIIVLKIRTVKVRNFNLKMLRLRKLSKILYIYLVIEVKKEVHIAAQMEE